MAKTLVIYYSRKGENYFRGSIKSIEKGNTEMAAEYIRDAVGADLFEVKTVKEYSSDYTRCTEEAQAELRNNERPELTEYIDDIDGYDNIVVAGPCWWGTYPMAIFSQLDRLDFTGKKVFPLITHEGSGLAGSSAALKKHCVGAEVGKGIAVHGSEVENSRQAIEKWAKENHL